MHYSNLLLAAAALFVERSLAVGILTYTGYDCTGNEQALTVDHNAACDSRNQVFRSYKENGWGPGNGQRIAFYQNSGCTANSWLYDTYSRNGDYFHSHQCYNIKDHSVSDTAQGANLY